VIEYRAPVNHRLEKAGKAHWLVGEKMLEFISPYVSKRNLLTDPYLANINPAWHSAIQSGYYLQSSFVLRDLNESSAPAKAKFDSLINKAATTLKSHQNGF